MNKSSKTNQQLLLEVEELRTRLDVAQQPLQEANGQVQAEMTKRRGTEQVLEERLNVFPIAIPSLRERPEDIPLLVWAFVRHFEKKMGKRIDSISWKSMEALQHHSWPGNVRELRNVIEHAMIVSSGRNLAFPSPKSGLPEAPDTRNLQDLERRHILDVLEKSSRRFSEEGGASEILGLKRTTPQSIPFAELLPGRGILF